MDFGSKFPLVVMVFVLTLAINLPFGYFRKRAVRYSLRWFLYIHLPIPVIIVARVLSNLDFKYVPIFVVAAVIGQVCGARMDFSVK